ncbi:General amino acid permease [Wickerhamomyces ciferrii]|uniref:General amino acid permease n=1 Tax=Wickerhamomyces ciferrii (strain ATCC 14091 / BCRC 22168 / CBS 111 / JCM 3599 / NBRC 0793 / NRRL Y-1031 F-60-10) TaxID=1206466 RepID=K0KFI7_WICCF|nr:General amino acid permease [Wickerhamomyces ciferrii]CCH41696.1 General amino acid permease [Wickerhamomyces ciferrii]
MGLFNRSQNNQPIQQNNPYSSLEQPTNNSNDLKNGPYLTEELTDQDPESLSSQSTNLKFDSSTGSKRALKNRHLSLIALAGIIGPGILLGAGQSLTKGGPLAMLIAVLIVGIIAYSMMTSIGEMISVYPAGNGFTTLARRFHSDALSAVQGYLYVIIWFCVLSNEYNAISSIMSFWDTDEKIPIYGYILIFWFAFQIFQILGVEAFGESEYWLALFKIIGLCVYYIFSIIYISGGIKNRPAFGFHYWNDPGALTHGFRGIATVFVYFSTFYSGTEAVAITANESKNPSIAIPRAVRQTTIRILFVYIAIAVFYGATVSSNDPLLTSDTGALKSPIGIALVRAGWSNGTHLVNAFVLVTCISAVNSSIYMGSRTLTNLATEKLAPRFLGWKDKRGVPIYAITLMNLLGLISLMNVSTGASKAYNYIVNISGVAVFMVWGIISFTHLRVRKAWKLQGYDISTIPYKSQFYPWITWFGLGATIFLTLVQGWTSIKPFKVDEFIDSYILIPFSIILYLSICILKKQWRPVDLETLDLDEGRRQDLEIEPNNESKPWYKKIFNSL